MPSPVSPFTTSFDGYEAVVPLRKGFRFLHEPVRPEAATPAFVGRERELEELTARLMFSNGGAFLVTGYRGVGKTSFVNQVIRKLSDSAAWTSEQFGDVRIIAISISIPRRIAAAELMHHLVRRLYERLIAEEIYGLLDRQLRNNLVLAYERTSLQMSRGVTRSFDLSGGKEVGIDSPLHKFGLKLPFEFKKSWSTVEQASFLGYDEKAAEHDLIRLSEQIAAGYCERPPLWRRLWSRLSRRNPATRRTAIRLIYVFDELDKIDEEPEAAPGADAVAASRSGIDGILRSLKTLFTTSGLSFVFVAGKDLYDHWIEDVERGDSVYESVFSYDKYLPCLWAKVHELCDPQIDLNPFRRAAPCPRCRSCWSENKILCSGCGQYLRNVADAARIYRDFIKYLSFRGRGIPRRIIRALNERVRWSESQAVLAFERQDVERLALYAELWDTLQREGSRFSRGGAGEIRSAAEDRDLLAAYYLTDWIMARGTEPFTEAEAIEWTHRVTAKIFPVGAAERLISPLIEVLAKADFVERLGSNRETVVELGAGGELGPQRVMPEAPPRYRVAMRRVNQLGGEAEHHPEDLFTEPPGHQIERCGEYTLDRMLGSGGMGKVYLGRHAFTRQIAAIKLLDAASAGAGLAARFQREADIMKSVRHPNIVQFYDSGKDGGRLYIAMEFLEGTELRTILKSTGALPAPTAAAIALPVVDAVAYLHSRGLVRNDMKPGNIMCTRNGRVCLVDLGITKPLEAEFASITGTGFSVGTPSYMAPEQIRGEKVDARSDIFALGVVLYEMLTGRHPFHGDAYAAIFHKVLELEPPPPSQFADIPPALNATVMRCLRKLPEERYAGAAELREALLEASPEIASGLAKIVREVLDSVKATQQKSSESTQVGEMPPPEAAGGSPTRATFPAMPVVQMSGPQPPPAPFPEPGPGTWPEMPSMPRSPAPAQPVEFTRRFEGPPPPAPAPPPPPGQPGEFTRMFGRPAEPAPAPLPPPPPAQPGEFTSMFGGPAAPRPAAPPPASPEPGEFTRMFGGPPAAPPSAPLGDWPPPAPDAKPGPFTLMFLSASAAKPEPRRGVGEQTAQLLPPVVARLHLETNEDTTVPWFTVKQPRARIGRSADNDIVLLHPSISRYHASISRDHDGFWIEDTGSKGGVFVEGQRVTGQALLANGADLRIGDVAMRFSVEGSATARFRAAPVA